MIFIGDIAMPSNHQIDIEEITNVFDCQPVVANLEGPILEQYQEKKYLNKKVLFNGEGQISSFKKMGIQLFSLANNHITDVPSSFGSTCTKLKKNDIQIVGGGTSAGEAAKPATIRVKEKKYNFLAFGWETIQCCPAKEHRSGVNPLRVEHVLQSVKEMKKSDPNSTLVLLMHWNYELEEYPQPFDRQLACRCIDEGVNAVIGCHSHCVQGIELYKNAPIVYSLGNWFIPHNTFFTGKLRFPVKSYLQLALEWEPGVEPTCHWFYYQPKSHRIKYLESESLSSSKRIERLTPFKNNSHSQYITWFKKNRVKKIVLPIFKNIDNTNFNTFKHYWVRLRDMLIYWLFILGLKKIRREI